MKRTLVTVPLALGAVAAGGYYVRVDGMVKRRLGETVETRMSTLYSDRYELARGRARPLKGVKARLDARRYLAVKGSPGNPGEYRVRGDVVELFTREYRAADGSVVPAVRATYVPSTGALKTAGATGEAAPEDAVTLEPVPLAPLGTGEVRASSYKPLSSFPPYVPKAFIAIEDKRFYSHLGVDILGIFRAARQNIQAGRIVQGGSTLTQQLAKNMLLTPKKTFGRKFTEVFAAVSLEQRLTKDEILDRYLNEIYFSQEGSVSVHGVPEAAENFFGKKVGELSLSEAAMLAGMPQAPTLYSPRRNYARSVERRDVVLGEMRQQGFITDEEYEAAKRDRPVVVEPVHFKRNAPYFATAVERELEQKSGVAVAPGAGIAVHTGIDPELQKCAEAAVAGGVERLTKSYPALKRKDGKRVEQALVAVEPYSGVVRAWVGGADFGVNQFDHVSQAKRQIGSTIKPFLYLTAMDPELNDYKVATAASILSDEPTGITMVRQDTWVPENYDHAYRGDVTLRYALEQSLNIPAVYVAQRVGIPALVRTVQKFRLAEQIPEVPALALGALDTTLLRLVAAYGAVANGGLYVEPRLFRTAADADGSVVASAEEFEEQIVDEGVVYVMTDMLRGVIERGTAAVVRRNGFKRPAAGKTGTSNDARDAWFVGFTPDLVAGVWTGFDDNKKIGITGGHASAPVWADFMKCAEPFLSEEKFVQPASVTALAIDRYSLKLAGRDCPPESVVTEIFVKGTEPIERADDCYPEDYARGEAAPLPLETERRPVYREGDVGAEDDYSNDRARPKPGFWGRLFGR